MGSDMRHRYSANPPHDEVEMPDAAVRFIRRVLTSMVMMAEAHYAWPRIRFLSVRF